MWCSDAGADCYRCRKSPHNSLRTLLFGGIEEMAKRLHNSTISEPNSVC